MAARAVAKSYGGGAGGRATRAARGRGVDTAEPPAPAPAPPPTPAEPMDEEAEPPAPDLGPEQLQTLGPGPEQPIGAAVFSASLTINVLSGNHAGAAKVTVKDKDSVSSIKEKSGIPEPEKYFVQMSGAKKLDDSVLICATGLVDNDTVTLIPKDAQDPQIDAASEAQQAQQAQQQQLLPTIQESNESKDKDGKGLLQDSRPAQS